MKPSWASAHEGAAAVQDGLAVSAERARGCCRQAAASVPGAAAVSLGGGAGGQGGLRGGLAQLCGGLCSGLWVDHEQPLEAALLRTRPDFVLGQRSCAVDFCRSLSSL